MSATLLVEVALMPDSVKASPSGSKSLVRRLAMLILSGMPPGRVKVASLATGALLDNWMVLLTKYAALPSTQYCAWMSLLPLPKGTLQVEVDAYACHADHAPVPIFIRIFWAPV